MLYLRLLLSLTTVIFTDFSFAQITMPAPSHTVFKCQVAGKVVYSDSPCFGAQKIDVEPTRSLNKSTGRELLGSDAIQEKQREAIAIAIKPITGMDAKQFGAFGRRMNLTSEAQKECKRPDVKNPIAEQEEKQSKPETLTQSQSTVLVCVNVFAKLDVNSAQSIHQTRCA